MTPEEHYKRVAPLGVDPHAHNAAIMLDMAYDDIRRRMQESDPSPAKFVRALAKAILLPLEFGLDDATIIDIVQGIEDARTGRRVFEPVAREYIERAVVRMRERRGDLRLPQSFPVRPSGNPDGTWIFVEDEDRDGGEPGTAYGPFATREHALGAMQLWWMKLRAGFEAHPDLEIVERALDQAFDPIESNEKVEAERRLASDVPKLIGELREYRRRGGRV